MDIRLLSKLLFLRACWKGRDRWSAERIRAHQERALQDLRRGAYAGSEFYRQHHAGLFNAPLSQLPPVTKAQLMSHFDQAVTDPGLRLADVEEQLRNLVASGADPGRPWRGRWWSAATAGTTCIVTDRVGSEDASEILIDGGHVGIVVGRSASQNLWPKVAAWLTEHD